jgi:hypothetical protein
VGLSSRRHELGTHGYRRTSLRILRAKWPTPLTRSKNLSLTARASTGPPHRAWRPPDQPLPMLAFRSLPDREWAVSCNTALADCMGPGERGVPLGGRRCRSWGCRYGGSTNSCISARERLITPMGITSLPISEPVERVRPRHVSGEQDPLV